MKPLESNLENRVVKWAKKRRLESLKLNVQGKRHYPDRLFFIPGGRPAIIEFKREGKKPRPAQQFVLNLLKALNYDIYYFETYKEAVAWLEECLQIANTTHHQPKNFDWKPIVPVTSRLSQIRFRKTVNTLLARTQAPRLSKARGGVVSISRGSRAVRGPRDR